MNSNETLRLPIAADEITIGGHSGGPYFAGRGPVTDWDEDTLTGVGGTVEDAIVDLKEKEADRG